MAVSCYIRRAIECSALYASDGIVCKCFRVNMCISWNRETSRVAHEDLTHGDLTIYQLFEVVHRLLFRPMSMPRSLRIR